MLKVVVTAADELLTDQGPLVPVDVLLVEDDPGDVLMTKEAFEQRGMRNRLHVVSDGEQAIEFLRHAGDFSAAPTPGLILLDLNLPRRNGLEVLNEVKSDRELLRIPVVVLTTSDAQEDIARSYSLHANAYVTKPIEFDRLHEHDRADRRLLPHLGKTPGRNDQRTVPDHDELSWRRVAIKRQHRQARPMESGRPIPSGLDQGRNEVISAIFI